MPCILFRCFGPVAPRLGRELNMHNTEVPRFRERHAARLPRVSLQSIADGTCSKKALYVNLRNAFEGFEFIRTGHADVFQVACALNRISASFRKRSVLWDN